MNWKDKRVLVTGCSGVIGRHLVKYLVEKEAFVRGVDLVAYPFNINNKRFELLQKDLLHLNPLEILKFGTEVVFHLAASFERTEEQIEFWQNNYINNLQVSHKLVDLFRYCDSVAKMIFASSYLVYDAKTYTFSEEQSSPILLKETSPKVPRNLTGAAKYYTEQEIRFFYTNLKRKFQFVNARIFRVYGMASNDIISRWIRACIKGDVLTLYNKENSFDYINSIDVAVALLRLAESDYSGAVNVGYGDSTAVSKIIDILTGLFANIEVEDKGTIIDFEQSGADISVLKKVTGWSPEIDIKSGIESIVEYESAK